MGKYHSIVWVPVEVPPGHTIPLIVLDGGQILYEGWYFFRTEGVRDRSSSWFEKAAQFIGRFYDFFRATQSDQPLAQSDANKLIANCIRALQHGTIQPDGTDSTGLFWAPWPSSKVSHADSVLKRFCESLADTWGEENPISKSDFARVTLSSFGEAQKKRHSKLFHLAARRTSYRKLKTIQSAKAVAAVRAGTAKAFPKDLLSPLLFEGCRRTRRLTDFSHPLANEYNLPLMMAIVLLAGGGLRKSEIFHLYADDVRADGIRLYDPVRGRISWRDRHTGGLREGQRVEYLANQFGEVPRNRLRRGHAQHAGWKSMLMDYGEPHYYAVVQWINGHFKALFHHLFGIYRDHVLPTGLDHPYLFISMSHGEFGRPWTVGAFNDAFAEALRRIGEEPDAELGRNPHGLRHRYGQTLVDMGLPPLIIQHAMHHQSIESQLIYTKPSAGRVREMLEAASQFNSDEIFAIPENEGFMDYNWKSDPLKLFAPWMLGSAM